MVGAEPRRRDDPDRALAVAFFRNAKGFLQAAEIAQGGFPQQAWRFLAIAIELGLKAYLLHRGISDDWNRIHIGHDLTKALKYARRAGLPAQPARMASLAAVLGPYYQTNTILRMPADVIASVDWAGACDTTGALLNAVDAIISRRDGDAPSLIGMVTS
jgi:hypothetical protein